MQLTISDRIPRFRLPASTGQTLETDSFLGKVPLVMFFLVDVGAEPDRAQLREYDEMHPAFGAERVQVLGVARATAREVRELADDMGVSVPILADAAGQMADEFGFLQPDGTVRRVTLLIDRSGHLMRRFDHAPPTGQAVAMLQAARALNRGDLTTPEDRAPEPPG